MQKPFRYPWQRGSGHLVATLKLRMSIADVERLRWLASERHDSLAETAYDCFMEGLRRAQRERELQIEADKRITERMRMLGVMSK